MEWRDLSPLLENGIPRWPTHPPLVVNPTVTHEHDGYYCQTVFMPEHIGSHVDAPAHIHATMMDHTIDTVPATKLIAPAVVYPLYKLDPAPGVRITADQVLKLEEEMGDAVGKDEIALFAYGWDSHAKNDKTWKDYTYNSPGLDEAVIEMFYKRGIRAAGSDTISLDQPIKDFDEGYSFGHEKYFLPNGILIMEGLVKLTELPPRVFFCALPLKIVNGSGSPIRCVAFYSK
ncbi:MAG: cyclase family protein [Planctomycetaceae bacterium]|nr:cyclase family protein [Planctomycetaceae bacterium]